MNVAPRRHCPHCGGDLDGEMHHGFALDDVVLDLTARDRLMIKGRSFPISTQPACMLAELGRFVGHVRSPDQLLCAVGSEAGPNAVPVVVHRINRALKASDSLRIVNRLGVGYALVRGLDG